MSPLAMTACNRCRPRWHALPRSQADVTVRPFPWLQTAQDHMKTYRTLSILVQATLCKTSTERAQVGSFFHPMQPSLRMWAVPKTVNAAARADREERQREVVELRVKRAADLGLSWPKMGDKTRQTTVVLCCSTSAYVPLKAQVQSLPHFLLLGRI